MFNKFNNILGIIIWINLLLVFTDTKGQGKSLQDFYSELCNEAYGSAEMYNKCIDLSCKYIFIDIENVKNIPVCPEVNAVILSTRKRRLNINNSFWTKFPNLKYLFVEVSDKRIVVKLDCSIEVTKLEYLSTDCNLRRFKLRDRKVFSSLKDCSLVISELEGNDYYSLFYIDSMVGIELIGTRNETLFDMAKIPSESSLKYLGLYNIKVNDEELFKRWTCLRSIFYLEMSENMKNYFIARDIRIGDVLR
ncbi:MAG: hypothetical protein ACK4WD_14000 [Flavobacteriales bacterium]|jgi:hypothetical protein